MLPEHRLLAAFLLSGGSGMVYQVLWARRFAVLVGSTGTATMAVMATLLAGTATGAFLLAPRAARAARGARVFGLLQLAVAVAGLLSLPVLDLLGPLVAHLSQGSPGPGTAAVAIGISLVACLPVTALQGATLAALARAIAQGRPEADATALLGGATAASATGAVAGSLGAAFLVLPVAGIRAAWLCAVASNLAAGVLALSAAARAVPFGAEAAAPAAPPAPRSFLAALLFSGLAASLLPIAAARVLALTQGDSVYTFALAGAASVGGAAATSAWLGRSGTTARIPPTAALAVAALAAAVWLPLARAVAPQGAVAHDASFGARLLFEALAALLVAGPAAIPSTWIFVVLAAHPALGGPSVGAGRATAWSAVGGALAPVLAGLALLPLGGAGAVGICAVAVLLLAAVVVGVARDARDETPRGAAAPHLAQRTGPLVLAVLCIAPMLYLVRGGLVDWVNGSGWHLVWKSEDAAAAVAVEEAPDGRRRLRTNNNFLEGGDDGGDSDADGDGDGDGGGQGDDGQGRGEGHGEGEGHGRGGVSEGHGRGDGHRTDGRRDASARWRRGLMPTLLVRAPHRVLVLGVSSGGTLAGVAAGAPGAAIDAVELLSDVERALPFFSGANRRVANRPGIEVRVADPRTFAARAAARGVAYDLVVGDLWHAAQEGVGGLYGRQHFQTVARLIGEGGLYCQWVPLQEVPPSDLRTVVRTFFRVFRHGAAFLGGFGAKAPLLALMGTARPLAIDPERWDALGKAGGELGELGRATDLARTEPALAWFLADAVALRAWAGEGPDNSDDHPALEFGAPLGRNRTTGIDSLVALLDASRPLATLAAGLDPARAERIARRAAAAAAFFRGSAHWRHEDIVEAETALRQAVIDAPDFAPPRTSLRRLAEQLNSAGHLQRGAGILAWLAAH